MIGAVKQPKFRRSGPIPEAKDRLNMCRRIRKNNMIGEFKNDRPTNGGALICGPPGEMSVGFASVVSLRSTRTREFELFSDPTYQNAP